MKLAQHAAAGMIAAVALIASTAPAASAAPSHRAQAGPAVSVRGVKAVLIHPYGGCGPSAGWGEVAANWTAYGTTPLRIDANRFCSSAKQVTYAELVASKANVLVLSDVAGGLYALSAAEIAAITQYVQAGHNVVATYATFLWNTSDNSALAPLFGLTSSFSPKLPATTAGYTVAHPHLALFRAVPSPYVTDGYLHSQRPATGYWTQSALSGAEYAARTAGDRAAITLYRNAADHYQAVYISSMPEYSTGPASPGPADLQLLYNALTLAR